MRKLSAYVLVSLSVAFVAPDKGLKDYYKNYFPIGVAVNPRMVQPGPDAELIKAQFNSMTPENAMKMGPIHPEENRYNWNDADAIADFAQQNTIKLRGHTLCWHNQTPRWFFTDSTGKTVSREVLLARLKRHITDVMGRYKGKIAIIYDSANRYCFISLCLPMKFKFFVVRETQPTFHGLTFISLTPYSVQ